MLELNSENLKKVNEEYASQVLTFRPIFGDPDYLNLLHTVEQIVHDEVILKKRLDAERDIVKYQERLFKNKQLAIYGISLIKKKYADKKT